MTKCGAAHTTDRLAVHAAVVDKAQTRVDDERGCIPDTHTRGRMKNERGKAESA
jgi:hypothetical protein